MSGRTILVKKRFGEETLDVREFIRPNTYMSAQFSDQLWGRSRTEAEFISRAHSFVVDQIHTPTAIPSSQDWHALYAFHNAGSTAPLVFLQTNDFWAYPSETLTQKMGDCDDKCILLVSLLRRYVTSQPVFCTVGTYQGVGHMWVTVGNTVLETTARRPAQKEGEPYNPMFRFNDKRVTVLRELQDTPLTLRR